MTEAEIGDAIRIIGADGNVSGRISHEVVYTRIPLQRHHRA